MGISKQPERWHKCVAATKNALPSIVDRLFIEHFFSEQDRQTALTMLDYIRAAFKANLEKVNPALRVHTRAPARPPRRAGADDGACAHTGALDVGRFAEGGAGEAAQHLFRVRAPNTLDARGLGREPDVVL
jgi:hypothetical protein